MLNYEYLLELCENGRFLGTTLEKLDEMERGDRCYPTFITLADTKFMISEDAMKDIVRLCINDLHSQLSNIDSKIRDIGYED